MKPSRILLPGFLGTTARLEPPKTPRHPDTAVGQLALCDWHSIQDVLSPATSKSRFQSGSMSHIVGWSPDPILSNLLVYRTIAVDALAASEASYTEHTRQTEDGGL